MTALLKQAIAQVSKLPADKQDFAASLLIDGINSEQQWDEVFAKHEDKLDQLEAMVLAEIESGQTRPMEALWEEFDVK